MILVLEHSQLGREGGREALDKGGFGQIGFIWREGSLSGTVLMGITDAGLPGVS